MNNIYNFSSSSLLHDELNIIQLVLICFFFLSVGSFASTLIIRLSPSNNFKILNVIYSRSNCISCKKKISFFNLIPIVGYLIQLGKCEYCKLAISKFYPLTEVLFCLTGFFLITEYGFSEYSLIMFLIFLVLYILFFLDFKYFYLPLPLNLSIFVMGFLGNVFFSLAIDDSLLIFKVTPVTFSILGFIFGYMFLFSINFIFKTFKKIDGIGGGDFILFGGIGSIFGPFAIWPIIFLASSLGILYYLFFEKNFRKELPLGSFIILGSIVFFLLKKFELFNYILVL